jgi:hypothetical protein
MAYYEANLDGTSVIGTQFINFNPLEKIKSSLQTMNWSFTEIKRSGTSMLKGSLSLGAVSKTITFTIGKVQDQDPNRPNKREKRIQITKANTTIGFNFNESSDEQYAIIGVYKREIYEDTIFCAWPKEAILNPNTAISVRLKIDLIAKALTNGFAKTLNDANQMVCAFRPEFIHYYLLNKEDLHSIGGTVPEQREPRITNLPYNLIYFGAPGTGKSNEIDSYTTDDNSVKITFHPDTDYAAFVGSYKPIQASDGASITYGFVAQAFLQAYTKAWETEEDTFLIIEEINRGNCAQIFGDVFQIIERGEDGYSKYKVDVDTEIEKYLKKHYEELSASGDAAKATRYMSYFNENFKKIALPNNLFIHATMNTSDQSLFPVDSAFKRRWDWEYVPIEFEGAEANNYQIIIDNEKYSWRSFVEAVNEKIKTVTDSEDKKLGQFFIKSFDNSISEKSFIAKVLFYIWNDILKDEPQSDAKYFFRRKVNEDDAVSAPFTFNDLFSADSSQLLKGFMKYLDIAVTPA